MRKSRDERLHESLASREPRDSFISTAALVYAAESPASWDYALFCKCRTFDEVKELAKAKCLDATNEFGQIQLARRGQLIGSFWLFD